MRRSRVRLLALAAVVVLGGCGGPDAPEPSTSVATSSTPPVTTSTPAPTTTASVPMPTSSTSTAPNVKPSAVPSRTPNATPSTSSAKPSAPVSTPTPAITGRVVSRLSTSAKVMALTFDGGSGAQGVESVLATLTREQLPATFFVTGAFADANPALCVRMARLGPVGNHTSSHPHLPQLSDSQVRAQVASGQAAILRAVGKDPRPLFRFPFGDYDTRTLRLVNELGYTGYGWSVDTLGWKGRSAGISVTQVAARVAAARTPGEIVLMHLGAAPDGSTLDALALPQIIAEARSAGYSFVSLPRS